MGTAGVALPLLSHFNLTRGVVNKENQEPQRPLTFADQRELLLFLGEPTHVADDVAPK